MSVWWVVVLVVGVNLVLWGAVGLLRWTDESIGRVRARRRGAGPVATSRRVTTEEVAVLMAAHDEHLVIGASLAAITRLVPAGNVHVVSDWSTDDTADLARAAGAHVLETPTNVGKAGALRRGIEQFGLAERFDVVLILDADTQLDPRYFEVALPLFDDERVVAVAGCAETRWHPEELSLAGAVVVAHRQRVYALTQRLLKYGQTWRGLSATHIVPGFASMYRARALEQIDVDAAGLVIEDFHMTFEVHAKRLGRIAFALDAKAYTQDPGRYRDYVRQTSRWALGLWQTLRRHHPRRGVFAAALAVLIAELVTSSLLLALLPVALLVLGVAAAAGAVGVEAADPVVRALGGNGVWALLGFGVLLPDYLLTCWVALLERRPRYLLLGLFFLPMRITDAVIALRTLPRAWGRGSTGRWTSPPRRAVPAPPAVPASPQVPAAT